MDITITFCDETMGNENSIRINSNQIINDTLCVLASNGLVRHENYYELYSRRNHIQINGMLTYEEANIYNGDVICIR